METHSRVITPSHLEVYCGPMKSGKSLALIQRVDKINYMGGVGYQFFKPSIDTRDLTIKSRFGGEVSCEIVDSSTEILDKILDSTNLVVIDEAQFFSDDLIGVVNSLLKKKYNVIIGGLDLDFRGEPFGPMPYLLSMANEVHKLTAVCEIEGCNNLASRTLRLIDGKPAHYAAPIVLIEGTSSETYLATCLEHHVVPR